MADTVEFPSLVKLGVAARRRLLLIGEFPRFWTLRRGAGEGEKVAIPVVCVKGPMFGVSKLIYTYHRFSYLHRDPTTIYKFV